MRHDRDKERDERREADPKPCWREMLQAACAGLAPVDQQLERMLDHLEQTR